jgi:hypothetical protein
MSKMQSFALAGLAPSKTLRRAALATFALVVLLQASFAPAQTLSGTVNNSSTGKPSAGDEIIVFSLDQGIRKSGRISTDAQGRFTLKPDKAQTRYLVRAIHQGVAYDQVVDAKAASVAIKVYDVAQNVNGIGVVADIMRIQASNGELMVTRDIGVRNTSNPPRVQLKARNLEFYIPDGARIIENSGVAIIENSPPMKSTPVAEREKNRYSFIFPLGPGSTRFEVSYQLPYTGSAKLDPKPIYPVEHFMVMLPKAMQFKAATSTGFEAMNLPNGPDAAVELAANTRERQNLAFNISGEGVLPTPRKRGVQSSMPPEESPAGVTPATHSNDRPRRGSGPRIKVGDILQAYRWWILCGLAATVIVSAVCVAWRQQAAARAFMRQKNASSPQRAMRDELNYFLQGKGVREVVRESVTAPTNSEPMEQIRERLFNIEIERKNGTISQTEFERAWVALDQMLDYALKREAQNA